LRVDDKQFILGDLEPWLHSNAPRKLAPNSHPELLLKPKTSIAGSESYCWKRHALGFNAGSQHGSVLDSSRPRAADARTVATHCMRLSSRSPVVIQQPTSDDAQKPRSNPNSAAASSCVLRAFSPTRETNRCGGLCCACRCARSSFKVPAPGFCRDAKAPLADLCSTFELMSSRSMRCAARGEAAWLQGSLASKQLGVGRRDIQCVSFSVWGHSAGKRTPSACDENPS